MVTNQAAEASVRLTWVEICVRYAERWVILDNIDWVNDTDFEFTGADVLGTFDTRKAASPTMKALIARRRRVGCFWTGDLVPPLSTSINILMAT